MPFPRPFVLALASAVVLSASALAAQATSAPVRECGTGGSFYGGAAQIVNVTSRNVSCAVARRFSARFLTRGGPACQEDRFCTYQGWACTNVLRGQTMDTRCVRAASVVRWQVRFSA